MFPQLSGHNSAHIPLEHVRVALEVEIPSDVRYIESIVELVAGQCAALAYAPRHIALNVPVALTEALSNAILRGNAENHTKQVRVRASLDPDRLILEVSDEGRGFDLGDCMRDPTTPENVRREDGRGLFLMQQLMDRVEQYDDHGNVVRLTLRRV
ncbi:MAG: ATP-binding protein [Gemmatimonadaceae bacterium]